MVENPLADTEGTGSVGVGEMPRAAGQLSPCARTAEPGFSSSRGPAAQQRGAPAHHSEQKPACSNEIHHHQK